MLIFLYCLPVADELNLAVIWLLPLLSVSIFTKPVGGGNTHGANVRVIINRESKL